MAAIITERSTRSTGDSSGRRLGSTVNPNMKSTLPAVNSSMRLLSEICPTGWISTSKPSPPSRRARRCSVILAEEHRAADRVVEIADQRVQPRRHILAVGRHHLQRPRVGSAQRLGHARRRREAAAAAAGPRARP